MRIIIATGIYPPEIGGPATYTVGLASRLAAAGHRVTVVTYSNVPRCSSDDALPFKLVRVVRKDHYTDRIRFFRALRRNISGAQLVYSLDWFAAGVPVALASRLARVPYIVRVGGDYLWEQRYLESGAPPLSLQQFYQQGSHRARTYIFYRSVIFLVLRYASRVVFNSDAQRDLYETYWGVSHERTAVIDNPVPPLARPTRARRTKELVYWGRFIEMKNLRSLIRAFARSALPEEYTLTLIGDGPQKIRLKSLTLRLGVQHRVRFERALPLKEVLERVAHCRAFILPSWTDISPNQVYEALAIGLPALVTRENYLRIGEQLPATFDPNSLEQLIDRLNMLGNDRKYRAFAKAFMDIRFTHDWDAVVAEHVRLFEHVLGRKDTDVRIVQIGADRSKQGILFGGTSAFARQLAYAQHFDALDIVGFSRRCDGATELHEGTLHVRPTNSRSRLLYVFDAYRIAYRLPRPDVVSAQDPFEAGLVGWLIARHFNVPLHVQVHTDLFAPAYAAHSLLNRLRVHIARFVLKRADRIRVVSQRIADSLSGELALKVPVTVLPIFTERARFHDASASAELTERFSSYARKLVCVARLEPEKHVALALRAFAEAASADACLIVVGEGSERGTLEQLAQELGIRDRVFFEGAQDPAPYYTLADLVLVPSRYEGYGLVIVEALAAGKPVLATDVGVAREAGAIIANEEDFAATLKHWFDHGPRSGELKGYPYTSFSEYVRAYCDELTACIGRSKAQ